MKSCSTAIRGAFHFMFAECCTIYMTINNRMLMQRWLAVPISGVNESLNHTWK